MIVSHKLKLIFLKTRKTSGTSIEIALSQHCGPEDILTPISPEDEKTRVSLGFRGPQNCVWGGTTLVNHTPAERARDFLGPQVWDSYFKVSIERNPFDRVISQFAWNQHVAASKNRQLGSLGEFLTSHEPRRLSNWPIYAIGDRVVCDLVIRYENLDAELAALTDRLGVEGLHMVRAKANIRTDRRPYREVLSSADRALVETLCGREIRHFGYAW